MIGPGGTLIQRAANQCPAVQLAAGFLSVADAGTLPQGNAPASDSIATGDVGWTDPLRRNATRADLAVRYGGGGAAAVAYGLGLSMGASGYVSVAPGHALLQGVVSIETPTQRLLPVNNTSFIWLLQDGSVNALLGVGTLPPKYACFLGTVTVQGGIITAVDTSGVLYAAGGVLRRDTADMGAPSDAPPASVQFLARTQGGSYWWDGNQYNPISSAVSSVISSTADTFACLQDDIANLRGVVALLMRHLTLTIGHEAIPPNALDIALDSTAFVQAGCLSDALCAEIGDL